MKIVNHRYGNKVFVMSNSITDAEKLLFNNNINHHYLVFVNHINKIRGIKDITIYKLGNGWKQAYFREIMEYALINNIDIINIPDNYNE